MSKSPLTQLYPPQQKQILIEDNSYIGAGSMVLKGVTLGKDAFVAAKSLVTKNVNPNTLVGGVPAREIKKINGIKETD